VLILRDRGYTASTAGFSQCDRLEGWEFVHAPENAGNSVYKSEGNRIGKLADLKPLPAEIAGNRTLNPMASAPDLYSGPSVSQEGS
jgi:hypothetical protein